MKRVAFTPVPTPALRESERSIADLMDDFERLVVAYQRALQSGDALASNVACDALKEAHLGALNDLFQAYRDRHARAVTNRVAGIDPEGPQPVGYVTPGELERLDDDEQAYLDPPSLVAPKSIPLFTERPLSAAQLAREMQDVATAHVQGVATDFVAEAKRILNREPRGSSDATPAQDLALIRSRIALALHYPSGWNTAAYPTLESAAWEAMGWTLSPRSPSGHVQD